MSPNSFKHLPKIIPTTSTGGTKLKPKLQISSILKIKGMNWRFMLEQIHIKEVLGFQS